MTQFSAEHTEHFVQLPHHQRSNPIRYHRGESFCTPLAYRSQLQHTADRIRFTCFARDSDRYWRKERQGPGLTRRKIEKKRTVKVPLKVTVFNYDDLVSDVTSVVVGFWMIGSCILVVRS